MGQPKSNARREKRMEIGPVVPVWLTWLAAGGVGVLAVAAVARVFEAVFDLDPN